MPSELGPVVTSTPLERDDRTGARLGVVILNWNGRHHLLACLQSLVNCRPESDLIVVVDNGSVDGSAEAVEASFPEVVVIRNEQNLGFAQANNMGSRVAVERGCDWVLILNNDTIVDREALGLLMSATAAPNVGVINPLIVDMDNRIWFSGGTFKRWAGSISHSHDPVDRDGGLLDITTATGCAMLVAARTVLELGPFDERYFIYFEDSDLSATLRRRGKRIVLQPAAVVQHKISADSLQNAPTGFFYYLNTRNRLLFTRHHLPTLVWLIFLARFTFGYVIPRSVALLVLGRVSKARAMIRGYLDFFRGRFGPPPL